jgi:heme/copper-type cytochrome/quinol oxidase subunit 3
MTAAQPEVDVIADTSHLPTAEVGPRSVVWWGTLGFMLLEGTGFVLAAGAYLYIAAQGGPWPPTGDHAPALLYGSIFTLGLLASQAPNLWLETKARKKDAKSVRWGALLMTLVGLALTAARMIEFAHLNVRWDHDAYGSLVWLLMVLHAVHLITDLGDTAVLTLWLFTHEPSDSQFSDVCDNSAYWTFVVVTWLPIYALIYWVPRWL